MADKDAQDLATKQSEERVDKAAWMNEQLAERLPDADYEQPGVAPAKDARKDGDYPVQGGKVASAPKTGPKLGTDKT